MRPSGKQLAAIVGVSVLSLGAIVGGGVAANAATISVRAALVSHSTQVPSTSPTPTPTHTAHAPGHDASDNDANDNDVAEHPTPEHPTPEPGDDDAAGTDDYHRGGSNSTKPAPAPHSGHNGSGHDDSGHDSGDDNGHNRGGDDSGADG